MEENKVDVFQKDLPQLIVALDTKKDSANYIHIADAQDGTTYYCPCCKGEIKPRAFKRDTKYQVQPHFYHESGGCNEESFVHFICKTWLFEKGSKFKIRDNIYEVLKIDVETTLHTSFGDYIPDIIVTTTIGKVLYFEIKTTNKKNVHYIPKWDDLRNDVVEVDTRYFINQKCKNNIPVFNLIHSDGECFIKSFTSADYDRTISRRKLEWKRQDKLNYKIHWERLDWFWNALCNFQSQLLSENDLLIAFDSMDYTDKLWCFENIKNKSCVSLKEQFKQSLNKDFFVSLESISENENIYIYYKHISPLLYNITCKYLMSFEGYDLFEKVERKIRLKHGIILMDTLEDITKDVDSLCNKLKLIEKKIALIKSWTKLPYIKSICPCSHFNANKFQLSELFFKISFQDHIHSSFLNEDIGLWNERLLNLNLSIINDTYEKYKKNALCDLENDFIKHALKNNGSYQKAITIVKNKCDIPVNQPLSLRISSDFRKLSLLSNLDLICEYDFKREDIFDEIGSKIEVLFLSRINLLIKYRHALSECMEIINQCTNKMWRIRNCDGEIILYLFINGKMTNHQLITDINFLDIHKIDFEGDHKDEILRRLYENMCRLIKHTEYHYGIRILEG